MCVERWLSYKNESENRFETPLLNKIEISIDNTIANVFKELSTNQNILFVLSANLSYEEMLNVKNLASKLNAKVSGYSPDTFDKNFADDFLKTEDKTANRNSFKELEIDETKEHFETSLNNSSLIVIVENSYFDTNEKLLENKKVISLFSHNCSTINHSNIAIPVASFYEKSGTYINKDGIKQKVISKIDKNNPKETITSIIEHLKSMIEKGTLWVLHQ